MYGLVHERELQLGSTLLKSLPTELLKHAGHATGVTILATYKTSCIPLHHLHLLDLADFIWVPQCYSNSPERVSIFVDLRSSWWFGHPPQSLFRNPRVWYPVLLNLLMWMSQCPSSLLFMSMPREVLEGTHSGGRGLWGCCWKCERVTIMWHGFSRNERCLSKTAPGL